MLLVRAARRCPDFICVSRGAGVGNLLVLLPCDLQVSPKLSVFPLLDDDRDASDEKYADRRYLDFRSHKHRDPPKLGQFLIQKVENNWSSMYRLSYLPSFSKAIQKLYKRRRRHFFCEQLIIQLIPNLSMQLPK